MVVLKLPIFHLLCLLLLLLLFLSPPPPLLLLPLLGWPWMWKQRGWKGYCERFWPQGKTAVHLKLPSMVSSKEGGGGGGMRMRRRDEDEEE